MIERKFKNESGENVLVRVNLVGNEVCLNIIGAKSSGNWRITRKEARELHCALHILEGRPRDGR